MEMATHRRNQRRASRVLIILILIFVAVFAAAAGVVVYTNHAAYQAMISRRVNAVHILRTSDFPQNHIPPFEKTIRNAALAQHLYDALMALPVMPQGTYNCPADFGVAYHLTFYQGHADVASALVKPDGCEIATLPDGSSRWAAPDPGFWQVFASVTGVPESDIRRGPGPDASPALPSATPTTPTAPTATQP